MKKLRCLCVLAFWLCLPPATICSANPPRMIPLWPGGAPGALGTRDSDKPSLDIYVPAVPASGSAVVVVPGGSYAHLALDHEGAQVARWLNDRGVAAFVLHYAMLPDTTIPHRFLMASAPCAMSVRTQRNSASIQTVLAFGQRELILVADNPL